MKKLVLSVVLSILCSYLHAQDFSNKGRDFWLCFPSHVPTDITTQAQMGLFITSDRNSSGTITVGNWSTTFTVVANQVTGPLNVPYSVASPATISTGIFTNKGIHVQVNAGQPPVVLYAHIYADARSEAALILPVNVLGKKYYCMSYYQDVLSVSKTGRSQFQVVATAPNTTIEYQLRLNGILSPTVQTAFLPNAGDVLQIQNTQDITGTVIQSVATATEPCKRIAVFSGSSGVVIQRNGCFSPINSSMDPLFQQCYPTSSWGNNYGVMPLAGNPNGFHARVMASENNTQVNFGGINLNLNAGEYYPPSSDDAFPYTDAFTVSSNKPVCVAEYMMSAYCASGLVLNEDGDPDMVILNPVEQNIADISLFSSNLQAMHQKYISVYVKTVAAPSFRINGNAPTSAFVPVSPANGYSYLTQPIPLSSSSLRLTADSGFNAIAYGLGQTESYAYSAGTFVRNRYQFLTTNNNNIYSNRAVTCVGTPFNLYSTFPYQPSQITWDFNGLFPTQTTSNPVVDSSFTLDGRTLYRYKLATAFTPATAGFFPIKISSVTSIANDGCTGLQEADYDLEILPPPIADFSFTAEVCNSGKIQFSGMIDSVSRPAVKWLWRFGNGDSSVLQNPLYTYANTGNYTASLFALSAMGCQSNTVSKPIIVAAGLKASFTQPDTICNQQTVLFTSTFTLPANTSLQQLQWNFGDGSPVISNNPTPMHSYTGAGTYNVMLTVAASNGCSDSISRAITVNPLPVLSFAIPVICVPNGQAIFNAQSNISATNYNWNFGDGATLLNSRIASHNYVSPGNYDVKLTAVSTMGCADSVMQVVPVNAAPVAAFTQSAAEIFTGMTLTVNNISSPAAAIRNYIWSWGDGNNETVTSTAPRQHIYNSFTERNFSIKLTAIGLNGCQSDTTSIIKIKPPDQLPFPVVPNAFSPNGDGINDTWVITGLQYYSKVQIDIFDRYGQRVFSSGNYSQPWAGITNSGRPLPTGTYYYLLELNDAGKRLTGSVTILR